MSYRIVETDGQSVAHVVKLGMFFDGTGRALCGRRPFPEKWGIPYSGTRKTVCLECLRVRRSNR